MPGRKPLILLFVGVKGHGKSELVSRLAHLLSLEVEKVNCASFSIEEELFGYKAPDLAHDMGSPLNNFLANKSGQRSIVFMDEFDKTSEEVHKTLLAPFDRGTFTYRCFPSCLYVLTLKPIGTYADRRNGDKVDCTNTIWILATNKFDDTVAEFSKQNNAVICDSDLRSEHHTLKRQLHRSLRNECIASFGAPLANQITEIIPFLTFNADEQAVIADKCIMELESRISGPVIISSNPDEDQPVGNVRLQITHNAAVCGTIAKEYYLPELGTRSIAHGVDIAIANPVVGHYLEGGDDLSEDQAETKLTVGTNEEGEVVVSPVVSASSNTGANGYAGFKSSWY